MQLRSAIFAALALCLALLLVQTDAWGKEGHQIVADIAYNQLNSNAQQAVNYYLNGLTLAAAAPFPDEYDHTSNGRWSGPLHYVNLPRNAVEYKSAYCPFPPGCVVTAIQNYTKQLLTEGTSGNVCTFNYGDMPCPLVFITHFVGDVHQPLHVGYGDDEGGNTVKIDFMGKKGNLHQVWDEFIIQKFDSDWQDFSSQLQSYMQSNPAIVAQYAAITDPAKWANESFQLVRTDVYNYNPSSVEAPEVVDLGQSYYDHNLPIIKQRLIAAGVRLGALINNIFSSGSWKKDAAKMHVPMPFVKSAQNKMTIGA